MKKGLLLIVGAISCLSLFSQLLTWTPNFPQESTASFSITVDASKGNKGLDFYTPASDVYVHTGVITNKSTSQSDWRYVKFNQNFNVPNAALNASYVGSFPVQKWQFTITGGIRAFYGITDPTETIQKISILFRNGNGSRVQRNADGSDMYIPVSDGTVKVKFTTPAYQPTFNPIPEPITKNFGDNISLTAVASSSPAATTMKIYFNGTVVQNAPGAATISANPVISTYGAQVVVAEAFDGANTVTDTLRFFVAAPNVIQALPAGVKEGANYEADQTAATLVLYAPGKTRVSVIGDLPGSNWSEQSAYQMKNTPDGNYWWVRVSGLTPGVEYAYQYYVDGSLKVGDAYTEKVLDPFNDQFIDAATYPSLKPYPVGLTNGMVSVLRTAAPAYNWQSTSFTRPDKRNLMIYELLVRDYLAKHDWKTLTDTLNYIKKLGINTIELLPFNEFEGNISWGYNPDFYFAPDKYYGPKNDLKAFIDSCHKRGIAVVMDIALNHSFGLSPMVQLYWDAANNRPAANNPWFNPVAKHGFNVGYDFNHESLDTRRFTSNVVGHWMNEYRIDGFRFDLSKGFTQTQTCDGNGENCDVNAWSFKDDSRIAIWKRYYDSIQLKSSGAYVILEHFAENIEEIELSNYGMLLWGNMNYNFGEAAMGWVSNSNIDGTLHVSRGWSNPYLVGYMESHDEERLMYKVLQLGNSSGGYNTKDSVTALKRLALSASFLLTMPGPKMIWQFGELGYDYPINYCQNGTVNSNCRTDPKPITWNYLQPSANVVITERIALFNVYKKLLQLRNDPLYAEAFTTGFISRSLGGGFKWLTLNSGGGKVVVVGNFDVVAQGGSVTFPAAGTWYDYLNAPGTFLATGGSQFINLQPGEFHVYTSSNVVVPVTLVSFTGRNLGAQNQLTWEVAAEQQLAVYELERSSDGVNFNFVAAIPATGSRFYNYTDVDIKNSPVYFYRLKKTDKDGRFTYSEVVKLAGHKNEISVVAQPNPFAGTAIFKISSPLNQAVVLRLSDLYGRTLFSRKLNVQAGDNIVGLPETTKLPAGTYIFNVEAAGKIINARIVKQGN